MAAIWQTVDFLTGVTGPDKVLPIVPNTGQYKHDIKGTMNSSVNVHKDLLGANGAWRNIKRIDTMIICHNPDAAWDDPDAILTGGYVNAVPASFGQTVNVTVGGVPEWMRMRAVCEIWNGKITDPNATYLFQGSTMQNTLHSLIKQCFSAANIPAGITRTPPQILRNVDGTQTTAPTLISKEEDQEFPEHTIAVNPANYRSYWDVIEEARDITSNNGNEVRTKLVFLNSSKTLVGLDFKIGSDTQPHINFNQTKTIYLERDGDIKGYIDGNKDYHVIDVQLNQNGDGYANRVIAQSTAGGNDEESDLQTKISNSGPSVLVDTFYNPNVKRDAAFFTQEINAKLTDAARYPLQGTITLIGNPAEWNNHLGKKLFIVEKTDDGDDPMHGFGKNEELRISDITVVPSENNNEAKITVGFVTPKARYPRLPRELKKDDPFNTGGRRTSTSGPVVIGRPANDPTLDLDGSGNGGGGGNTGGDGTGTQWGGKATPDSPEDSKLAAGYRHTMGIASDGTLYGWGWNEFGQLGLGFKGYSTTLPTKVGTDTDWKNVWGVNNTTFAMKEDNSLWGWGNYPVGLPTYPENKFEEAQFGNPMKIMDNVRTMYSKFNNGSGLHVIKLDGTLWAAGHNESSQGGMWLGFADGLPREEFMQIGTKTDWVKVEANENASYMAALDAAGMVWVWGSGIFINEPKPMTEFMQNPPLFSDIAVHTTTGAGSHNWGVAGVEKVTGKLYTWGTGIHEPAVGLSYRPFPQLYSGPIETAHSLAYCNPTQQRPMDVNLVISTEGPLMKFGMGHSWGIHSGSDPVNFAMGTDFDWRQPYIAVSNQSHYMVILNGELWVSGWNYSGQLGTGNTIGHQTQLIRVGEATAWKRLATCHETSYGYSLAVLSNNMYGTGRNNLGQLGMGTKTEIGYIGEDTTDRVSWTRQPDSGNQE